LLSGRIKARSYAFFVNAPGVLLLALIPFVGFDSPNLNQTLLAILAGGVSVLASFLFYSALEQFEASRVVPALGAILPLFTIIISFVLFREKTVFHLKEIIAFILLVSGSVLISFRKGKNISLKSFSLSIPAAFLFSLWFVLIKNLYLELSFWTVIIVSRAGAFLFSLFFMFDRELRKSVFQKPKNLRSKTGFIFLINQGIGTVASLLQNWAIVIVPFGYLAFINALEGTRYIFLFILSIILSLKFPGIGEESLSKTNIIQKTAAILITIFGLIILAFN